MDEWCNSTSCNFVECVELLTRLIAQLNGKIILDPEKCKIRPEVDAADMIINIIAPVEDKKELIIALARKTQ